MRKKLFFFSEILSLGLAVTFLVGCAGRTANLDPNILSPITQNKKFQIQSTFRVDPLGMNMYVGGPTTFPNATLKASVDIRHAQEVAAAKVIESVFTGNGKRIDIESKVTYFGYKWPGSSLYPCALVSFDVHITAKTIEGKQIYSKNISIRDRECKKSEEAVGLGVIIPIFAQGTADAQYQNIGENLLIALYSVYSDEFNKIGEINTGL